MAFLSLMPNLYVAGVERSAAFYRDLLGGTETFRLPAEGPALHVELRLGTVIVAISAATEVPKQGCPRPLPATRLSWSSGATRRRRRSRASAPPVCRSWSSRTATSRAPAAATSPTRTAIG